SISMVRKLDRKGYSLHISEVMNDYPGEDKQIAASYINKVIEREILRAPEQYLWVHRRFKTRPLGETSVY
ncbi:lipid A biosynthesis palmitoleoyl acyltransferase, partial [Klebsiella aerogenes]